MQYGTVKELRKAGLDIKFRGVKQLLNGFKNNKDTISITALKDGVVLFSTKEFEKLEGKLPIKFKRCRDVYWDTDKDGVLYGVVKQVNKMKLKIQNNITGKTEELTSDEFIIKYGW